MPSPQGKGRVSMPAVSSHILWLKYQGVGNITASPALAIVDITAQNA